MVGKRSWSCLLVAVLAATVLAYAAQAPAPDVKARVDAFFQALASGNPDRFEAMARDNYTPDLLAQRSVAERKAMVERIRADFGQMTLSGIEARGTDSVAFTLRGANGMEGQVEMSFEPTPPRRIARVGIRVEAGGGRGEGERERPPLPPAPIDASMSPADLSKALDGYIGPLSSKDAFAGVVLVGKEGHVVYEKPYGLADRDKGKPIAATTRFNLGSINKIFTKTAIAQLVAQGKLALADTIGKLLPDYPNAGARVATVTQLLNHQAGIADFFGPDFAAAPKTRFRSNADYYGFVSQKPLTFAPGTKTQYCNGCYIVLGAIIERVAGVSYEEYIRTHVFEPAGMKTAAFLQSDRFPPDAALGYTRRAPDSAGQLRSNETMHGASGSAAGGAYATAADLLAFDNALRERRLLDAKMTAWVLDVPPTSAGTRVAGGMAIAGGAPGCNAVLHSDGTWTVVVVGNLDPPAAERLGAAINRQLERDTGQAPKPEA